MLYNKCNHVVANGIIILNLKLDCFVLLIEQETIRRLAKGRGLSEPFEYCIHIRIFNKIGKRLGLL